MIDFHSSPIRNLSFIFAVNAVKFSDHLIEMKKYTVSNQLIRACCSIGANVSEAQNAESKADFIHKLKIAAKEADESKFWCLYANKQTLIQNLDIY